MLSSETVRSHIKNLLRKLGVSSRQAAVEEARRLRADLAVADEPRRAHVARRRRMSAPRSGRRRRTVCARTRRDALLDAFASRAAHSLGAGVSIAGGYATLLRERFAEPLGAEGLAALAGLEGGLDRLRLFVDDLLELSALETTPLKRGPLRGTGAARAAAAALAGPLDEADVEVEIGPLPDLVADSALLERLFHHLIRGSLAAIGAGPGRIEISGVRRAAGARIEVSDDGPPLHRSSAGRRCSSRSRRRAGPAPRRARASAWRSRGASPSATAARPGRTPAGAKAARSSCSSRRRCDRRPRVRGRARHARAAARRARRGPRAERRRRGRRRRPTRSRLAEALQPDVVLLDIGMPGPATADVVAGVRAAAPDAAIVVLSGFGPERLDPRVAREVAAHLPKTTDLDAVRRTLRAAGRAARALGLRVGASSVASASPSSAASASSGPLVRLGSSVASPRPSAVAASPSSR